MRLTPRPINIDPDQGFTKENDIFGFGEFGDQLLNIISNLEEPLVFAIDGHWGSGKTTFSRQWLGQCRLAGIPSIVFDAFQNDYHKDAFIAIASTIIKSSKAQSSMQTKIITSFTNKAKNVAKIIAPVATNIAVKTITANIVSGADVSDTLKNFTEHLNEKSDDIGKAISAKIESSMKEEKTFEEFKNELTKIAKFMGDSVKRQQNQNPPLIILVDELDRCSPAFAIDVIEKIKHFFSVPGICFVLVSNFDQTEKAIKSRYGQETDAKTYLEKFFHFRASLPPSPPGAQHRGRVYFKHLCRELGLLEQNQELTEALEGPICRIIESRDLSLRTVERISTRCCLSIAALSGKKHLFIAPVVATLAVMSVIDQELFMKAEAGIINFSDIKRFLNFKPQGITNNNQEESENDWHLEWWRYALDINHKNSDISNYLFRYNINNRMSIVTFSARYVTPFRSNFK